MSNRTEPPRTVEKVWGTERWLVNGELYCCKRLHVNRGYQCSFHRHLVKDETFIVEWGHGQAVVGGKLIDLEPGAIVEIPPGTWHKFWCPSDSLGLMMLEVSTHHDDADVERSSESGPIPEILECDALKEARIE